MGIRLLAVLATLCLGARFAAAAPVNPVCIVPSEPEGGFQITCELARDALKRAAALPADLAIERVPGGVGAIAFNVFTSTRRNEPGTLIAFSEGSLYNLARGKFGPHNWTEVRWVAALGLDHGAIAVRADAPWQTLPDLMKALAERPAQIAIGGSGTINGRDWMRASSTARLAGVDIRNMRFVAFEGGGDCIAALVGNHVQVCMNDAATTQARIEKGQPVRMLAIYAEHRLPGALQAIPTAREQGFDIVWPVVRGVYMGPDTSEADYQFWVETFRAAMALPGYEAALNARHLLPLPLTGAALTDFVRSHATQASAEKAPI